MVATLISTAFRSAALIRGVALISIWTLKSATLIRGRSLFETRHLLEEMRYLYLTILSI